MWSSKQGPTSHRYIQSSVLRWDKKDRFFHTASSNRTPRLLTAVSLYGKYIFGGGLCTGVCLLWYYYQNNSQILHAKTNSSSEFQCGSEVTSLDEKSRNLENAVSKSRILLQRVKDEHGCPGIVAAVSVNGHHMWKNAIGLADVENRLLMTPDHVIRIASISKSLTVTALAKLWEEEKLDIDKPVQELVPSFPQKTWENEKVTITTRQLLSHLSGIRHYQKVMKKDTKSTSTALKNNRGTATRNISGSEPSATDNTNRNSSPLDTSVDTPHSLQEGQTKHRESEKSLINGQEENKELGDAKYREFFSSKKYKEVVEALEQFKDDPLVHKPGTKFLYSTHAWTLVGAVVESAANKPYLKVMKEMFDDLGLHHTLPDEHALLIPNRARLYQRSKKTKKLENAPYVDVSNKWAGGGFLSTVDDLLRFADAMLYSYQYSASSKDSLPGYLKQDTIRQLWVPIDIARHDSEEGAYGMGWKIIHKPQRYGKCQPSKFFVSHTGGAIGASSILLIAADSGNDLSSDVEKSIPRGVSVAIIVNTDGVSLHKTAEKIAILFKDAL